MKSYYYWVAEGEDQVSKTVKTEKQILDEYWEWWSRKMIEKYGPGAEEITEEHCIHDWCMHHYAKEVTDDT